MAKNTPDVAERDNLQEPNTHTTTHEQADVEAFERIYERYGQNLRAFFRDAQSEAKRNALEKCARRDAGA